MGQMDLWVVGDWDPTRVWGCDCASELIVTDADIQDSPGRCVYKLQHILKKEN
jgi:hypothetical protein